MAIALFALFWVSAVASSTYALRHGGPAEQIAGVSMFAAGLATPLARWAFNANFKAPMIGMVLVDLTLAMILIVLALRSDRFWPMTVAALQIMGVLTHPALAIDRDIHWFGYAFIQGFWCFPMMALLAWATRRRVQERRNEHHRASSHHEGDVASSTAA